MFCIKTLMIIKWLGLAWPLSGDRSFPQVRSNIRDVEQFASFRLWESIEQVIDDHQQFANVKVRGLSALMK